MILDLRQVFSENQNFLNIDTQLDLSGYEIYGQKPITQPVSVVGAVKNSAGVVTLDVTASLIYNAPCDRCTVATSKQYEFKYVHTLADTLSNDDNEDIILVEDLQLNLDDLIGTDIILSLPTKFLCSEDCKGVCAGCGKNLNTEKCVCDKEIDPRLAKLKDFFE